jgi:hypothetical protein
MWENPTEMTVKADNKKRVIIREARPGDVFVVENQGNGHFHLVRLTAPEPPQKPTRREVRERIKKFKLRGTMSWEELRQITREP